MIQAVLQLAYSMANPAQGRLRVVFNRNEISPETGSIKPARSRTRAMSTLSTNLFPLPLPHRNRLGREYHSAEVAARNLHRHRHHLQDGVKLVVQHIFIVDKLHEWRVVMFDTISRAFGEMYLCAILNFRRIRSFVELINHCDQ